MKVHLEIIVFGENTPHFYKNKNIIYSLLSPPILYSEKGNDKNIHDLNELTSNFHASKFGNSSGLEISKASYFPGQLPY